MSGKLTVEQVRECVEDLYWEGYNDGYVHRGHGIEETDWQAITDKLNSRAERICYKVIPDEMEGYVFCSECGAEIGEYGYPNYCPNCGRNVK